VTRPVNKRLEAFSPVIFLGIFIETSIFSPTNKGRLEMKYTPLVETLTEVAPFSPSISAF
jgi:hypothetical protein